MLYASYAGDTLVASGAEVQAMKLATKDEKKDVAAQIKEIKKQVGERNQELQKQIQEQFSQQAQGAAGGGAPANPFGGIGGSALLSAGASNFQFSTLSFSGPVAQLAEQGTLNPKVEGSIPSWPISVAERRVELRPSAAHGRLAASPPASLSTHRSAAEMRRSCLTHMKRTRGT